MNKKYTSDPQVPDPKYVRGMRGRKPLLAVGPQWASEVDYDLLTLSY